MAQYELLQAQTHSQWRLLSQAHYGFAADWTFADVILDEWNALATQHPIVFVQNQSDEKQAQLVLRAGPSPTMQANPWVNAQGLWLGQRLPGVMRLHPFALASLEAVGSAVCIDVQSPWLSLHRGTPLFSLDGQPSTHLTAVMRTLKKWESRSVATQKFARALDRLGLLRPLALGRSAVAYADCWQVDEERLAQLSSAGYLLLRKQGWLKAVHAHLVSLGHFYG